MSDWKATTWGKVITLQRGVDITKAEQDLEGSIPVISSGGVASHHSEFISEGPGVVIGRKGTLGTVFYSPGAYWPHDTTLWVKDFKGNDPRFVYYALRGLDTSTLDVGSSNPTLNRNHVHPLPVNWPSSLAEQQRIAGVLGALDDLIETNRRLARELQSLLFAKYEALAEGQPMTAFGQIACLARDQWKPGDEGPSRYLGLEHFATGGAGLDSVGYASNIQSVSLRFQPGDVLYGKLRPYFRKVARPGFAGLCSSEIWVLRAQEGYPQSLVHAIVHAASFSEAASVGSTGTRMPRADWKHVSSLPVPDLHSSAIPMVALEGIENLWSGACCLDQECDELAGQRDELLPLLMSGKVRVSEVEEVA